MKTVKKYQELTEKQKVLFETLVAKHKNTFYAHQTVSKYDFVMVMTPSPYVILKWNRSADLEQSVIFLYTILKMLGIRKGVAATNDFTLNYETCDKLRSIAWNNKNKEAATLIANHTW